VAGHASASERSCHEDFFLNDAGSWPPDANLYVWLYPASAQVIVRGFAIRGVFEPQRYGPIVGDVLRFFPIAFWLTHGSARVAIRTLLSCVSRPTKSQTLFARCHSGFAGIQMFDGPSNLVNTRLS
jgi:hypothetical protein